MSRKGYVYIRTDAREQTFELTRGILRDAFPRWRERIEDQPSSKHPQKALYGDKQPSLSEKDIILCGPQAG
jgi:hypothetical protein